MTAMHEGAGVALLVALVAGHVLGDFLIQTQAIADRKGSSAGGMATHGALVFAAHAAVLAPVMSWWLLVLTAGIAVVHTLTDVVRSRTRGGDSLVAFGVDQAVHVGVLVLAWRLVLGTPGMWGGGWVFGTEWMGRGAGLAYARFLATASGYIFCGRGGTAVVRKTLAAYPRVVEEFLGDEGGRHSMGRAIGNLERFVTLTLLLFGQWAAVGLVVAAKSIARFPELRDPSDKDFAEYYLIGTLTSLLVAMGSAVLLTFALDRLGPFA